MDDNYTRTFHTYVYMNVEMDFLTYNKNRNNHIPTVIQLGINAQIKWFEV